MSEETSGGASGVEREPKPGRLERMIAQGLDLALRIDRDQERAFVRVLREGSPGKSTRELADTLIRRARWWGAGAGFTTGLSAAPWSAVPAALVDVGAMLRVEVILAIRIALLFDEKFLDGEEPPYEVLVPIFETRAAGELLREAGIRGGMGGTRAAIAKFLTGNALRQFQRVMLKYFGLKVTQRGVITKTVPIVGAIIGAGWNFGEIKLVGERAYRYFDDRQIHDDGAPSPAA